MAKEATTPKPVAAEPVYEAKEIAANAPRLFGYSVDIATAALTFNKLERCTLEKAKKLIKEFAERKVK